MSNPLLPQRHPLRDFFIDLETVDVTMRSDMASMGHPIFSLSTQTDMRTLRYEHDKTIIEIHPSSKGLARTF
jgi:Replication initiator protein A